jgi:hypothetical protein
MEPIKTNPGASSVTPIDREKAISQFNNLLQGEISAVETYRIAVDKMRTFGNLIDLQNNLASHETRVSKLRARIVGLSGKTSEGSGAWGAFAKLVEGGAAAMGDATAIKALEEGEDRGLREYRETQKLDPSVQQFVQYELLAAQTETHATMSALKRKLSKN